MARISKCDGCTSYEYVQGTRDEPEEHYCDIEWRCPVMSCARCDVDGLCTDNGDPCPDRYNEDCNGFLERIDDFFKEWLRFIM